MIVKIDCPYCHASCQCEQPSDLEDTVDQTDHECAVCNQEFSIDWRGLNGVDQVKFSRNGH